MFPHSVSRAPAHRYAQPSLRAVRPQFILVCSNLLFRVPTLSFPFELLRAQTHLPGFLPSSRRHQNASTIREAFQLFATLRPQAFSTSRRFLPRSGSRACSIPQPRPGFNLFKGFSLCAATLPHRKELAPLPLASRRSLTEMSCHDRLPRLRGFSLRPGAFQHCGD